MEKISFDSGVKEFEIGNGVLRFNPADPNLYVRFMGAQEKIQALETDMVKQGEQLTQGDQSAEGNGEAILRIMAEADRKAKDLLNEIFGAPNDFHSILGGVSLMAVATNGERVITNLFAALTPILTAGAQACTNGKVAQAKMNRAQRRAAQRAK